jgi:hypothetical protein
MSFFITTLLFLIFTTAGSMREKELIPMKCQRKVIELYNKATDKVIIILLLAILLFLVPIIILSFLTC